MTPPPPSSDDSAVESMSSVITQSDRNYSNLNSLNNHEKDSEFRPKITRPSSKDLKVDSDDLRLAALHMRSNNFCLLSRSIRTVLNCFDDLEIRRFETNTDYLINFISNGVKATPSALSRPVSILWPDCYEELVNQISFLDAHLLNVNFREKPVDWMLSRGLTLIPNCQQCKNKMNLIYNQNRVRWLCQTTQACLNYFMPVQRPSFFSSYENITLDKLLFSIYYWSTCTPSEELYDLMKIDQKVLDSLWRRIQNVCRNVLEKKYPRMRLTNDYSESSANGPINLSEPIDLISIKVNEVFVVCAKHPHSNLIRLGLYIPNVSLYSFAELTESWFAHGSQIRVSETKFLDLPLRRTDLKVELVSRYEMVSHNGRFSRRSAFGYLICQLSHILKDFNSSSLSCEDLKLILAEIEWREIYGTNPYEAFTNIVNHLAEYGETSDWYTEPSLPLEGEETLSGKKLTNEASADEYLFAEKYFYASADPTDSDGKIICRFTELSDIEKPPPADVRIRCHECGLRLESFDFTLHMIAHVERNRKEQTRKEYNDLKVFECKHCFKIFPRDQLIIHSTLVRTHLHMLRFGCRICCIKLNDRAQYLQHMRRLHFEHETPYRCPVCPFSSSFQRDVFIHFQEEHRHSMVILCILCLRSFTVKKPELMDANNMTELSKIVYNHIAEHYAMSKGYTCSNCCLCFLNKEQLLKHKKLHHNPSEVRPSNVKLSTFIVTPDEEPHCVKALPMELFISNKRPNLVLDHNSKPSNCKSKNSSARDECQGARGNTSSNVSDRDNSDMDESDNSNDQDDENHFFSTKNDGTIYVRGLNEADKFLAGGGPSLRVFKVRTNAKNLFASSNPPESCSSQKLIEYLSRMNQADAIVANQSAILTPRGRPAKCCECLQYVTTDHYVAMISCKNCSYLTHCPRAAIAHNKAQHSSDQ